MVAPPTMPLFDLPQLLALFVCEIRSHLPVRVSDGLMNAPRRLSPNVSELGRCFVDDRRNFGHLLRRQVQLRPEPFLHPPADQFRAMKRKEMMPGIQSSQERASNSSGDKDEDESSDEFPLQRPVHLKTRPESRNPRWRIHS
jgi:hypothetical protein